MTNINTDTVTFSIADEDQGPPYGVLPMSPIFALLEPNTISKFGAETTTVFRTPISKNLQRLKGKLTDLKSGFTFTHDLTMELLARLLPAAMFAKYEGPGNLANGDVYRPTEVTGVGFVVADDGDLANGTLIYGSGFAVSDNNGLKVTAGGSTTVLIKAAGLSAEAATIPDSQNATVAVAGVQGPATEFAIDADGNLTSGGGAGPHVDFTDLGLSEGQFVEVGGTDAGSFFDTGTGTTIGSRLARIAKEGIASGKLTLEKKTPAWVADVGTGKTIQVFFGRFCRNVARDDADYLFQTHTIEVTWPGLDGGTDSYSYAKGNLIGEMAIELPIANKGGMTVTMIGTDTEPPTDTREDNADEAREPVLTDTYNTSSEIARIRATETDETEVTADLLNATISLKVGASGKNVLGNLGAKYLNRGLLEADIDTEVLFTDGAVIDAIRNNRTMTAEAAFRNADGQGFVVDIPELVFTDGAPAFPLHDQVSLKLKMAAHRSTVFGYSISVSLFPYIPKNT